MNMFSQFLNDKIKIIKKDGTVSKEIRAMVATKHITIHEIDVDISEGDFIERLLPNNKKEKFLIIDTGYQAGFNAIPARYECKVEKQNILKPKKETETIYHLSGNNSRVYNNSQDYSTNNVTINSDNLFTELKKVIRANIKENRKLLKLVTEMENNKDHNSFLNKYREFISAASDHITILSPFIPPLTALLK